VIKKIVEFGGFSALILVLCLIYREHGEMVDFAPFLKEFKLSCKMFRQQKTPIAMIGVLFSIIQF